MSLVIYNTISRKKEEFKSIVPGYVGMYVCGPTVYGYPHLGHGKSYVCFDVIYRYLMYLGYKVKYVQNITDVGHLVGDSDSGEDKIERIAKLQSIDPVEIAYKYENIYFEDMRLLNVLKPSISSRATGHIIEIINDVKTLIDKGYAYVSSEGNVYYRINMFKKYGSLSNRSLDQVLSGERIEVASDKENPSDFALWKKATNGHIMKWPSPWGEGYPGWHIECSVMSRKYLGDTFDIHGGGMDNIFPHHECEIAQSEALTGKSFVNYFIHNNLVTVNGQKMGKSLNNFITLDDLFKKYDPMVVRYYILLNHYRKPTDFNDLQLVETDKQYKKISESINSLRNSIKDTNKEVNDDDIVKDLRSKFISAMDDDFNTGLAITYLLDIVKLINIELQGNKSVDKLISYNKFIIELVEGVLGLRFIDNNSNKEGELINIIQDIRNKYREEKNYIESDKLRDKLSNIGININDRRA